MTICSPDNSFGLNKNIYILNVDNIPSYLKIKKALFNTKDFLQYISELGPYGAIMAKENYIRFSACDNSVLAEYID